eukprot:g5836.t1
MKKTKGEKSKRRVFGTNTDGGLHIQNKRKQNHAKLNEFARNSWQQQEGDTNSNMVPKSIDAHKIGVISQRQDPDANRKMDVSAEKLEGLDAKDEPLSSYMRRRISILENEDKNVIPGQ